MRGRAGIWEVARGVPAGRAEDDHAEEECAWKSRSARRTADWARLRRSKGTGHAGTKTELEEPGAAPAEEEDEGEGELGW